MVVGGFRRKERVELILMSSSYIPLYTQERERERERRKKLIFLMATVRWRLHVFIGDKRHQSPLDFKACTCLEESEELFCKT